MKRVIFAIGREFGSGGRIIGERLAEALGIAFYDKELIFMTAQASGLHEEIVEQAEKAKTKSFLYGLYTTGQQLPLSDQVFIAQFNLIKDIAAKESCVIVGRCADYVLKDNPDCFRVFVHAPMADRIKRAVEEYGVEEKNIESFIKKEDKRRASYYNHFTQQRWGDSKNFHLSIDSSIGCEKTIYLIKQLAKDMKELV